MRIAKATKEDIEVFKRWLLKREHTSHSIPNGWRRVVWAADILIDTCCDPTEDTLQWSPYLNEQHVAPEQ